MATELGMSVMQMGIIAEANVYIQPQKELGSFSPSHKNN